MAIVVVLYISRHFFVFRKELAAAGVDTEGDILMKLDEFKSIPALKIMRDLNHELVPRLDNDLGTIACNMGARGLLGPNSVAEREVYLVVKPFGVEVIERAMKYFREQPILVGSQQEFEDFLGSVVEYMSESIFSTKFSRPPFKDWYRPVDSVCKDLLSRVKAEAEIIFCEGIPGPQGQGEQNSLNACRLNDVNLSFMHSVELQRIAARDLGELQAAIKTDSVKTVLVLSGSILECLLLDRLQTVREKAEPLHPQRQLLERWDLNELINIAGELKILPTATIAKFSHGLREFRNLIHPGRELRETSIIAPEEARIAVEVVNIVLRTFAI